MFYVKKKSDALHKKWVDSKNKKCLVIQGARQTGKTYIVEWVRNGSLPFVALWLILIFLFWHLRAQDSWWRRFLRNLDTSFADHSIKILFNYMQGILLLLEILLFFFCWGQFFFQFHLLALQFFSRRKFVNTKFWARMMSRQAR